VVNVGDLLGLKQAITHTSVLAEPRVSGDRRARRGYDRLDPADMPTSPAQAGVRDAGPARYDQLRRAIRARYKGVPVGYSESIFQPLGEDLA